MKLSFWSKSLFSHSGRRSWRFFRQRTTLRRHLERHGTQPLPAWVEIPETRVLPATVFGDQNTITTAADGARSVGFLRDGAEGIGLGETGDSHSHDQFFLGQTPVLVGLPDDTRRPVVVVAVINVSAVAAPFVQHQSIGVQVHPLPPGGLDGGNDLRFFLSSESFTPWLRNWPHRVFDS